MRLSINRRKAKADLTICYLRHIEVKAKREESLCGGQPRGLKGRSADGRVYHDAPSSHRPQIVAQFPMLLTEVRTCGFGSLRRFCPQMAPHKKARPSLLCLRNRR